MSPPRATRRELLTGAVAAVGGAGALAAGLEGTAAADAQSDAQLLVSALAAEQLVAATYRYTLAAHALLPAVAQQLTGLLNQEVAHIALLTRLVAARGATAPAPVSSNAASLQRALAAAQVDTDLSQVHRPHAYLLLLIDVETVVEGSYYAAIGQLSAPTLVRTCASLLSTEAQHWTLLYYLRSHGDPYQAVPYPFVKGSTGI